MSGEEEIHESIVHGVPEEAKQIIYVVGHMSAGVISLLTASVAFAVEMQASDPRAAPMPEAEKTRHGLTLASAVGVAEGFSRTAELVAMLFDEPIPMASPAMVWLRRSVATAGIVSKVGFAIGHRFGDLRPIAAGVDAVLGVVSLVPTVYDIVTVAQKPGSIERDLTLIDESGNIIEVLATIAHFAATLDEDEESKIVIMLGELLLIQVFGTLHIAMAGLRMVDSHGREPGELAARG